MPIPLGPQTVTLVTRTPGAKDNMGVPQMIETTTAVPGCSVQPATASEDVTHDVDRAETLWKLYAPPGTNLRVVDAIITPWDGLKYEVTGDPQTWVDAFGNPSNETCLLRRVTG